MLLRRVKFLKKSRKDFSQKRLENASNSATFTALKLSLLEILYTRHSMHKVHYRVEAVC